MQIKRHKFTNNNLRKMKIKGTFLPIMCMIYQTLLVHFGEQLLKKLLGKMKIKGTFLPIMCVIYQTLLVHFGEQLLRRISLNSVMGLPLD